MKVYTKVVWEWRGDELVQIEAESYEYEGPVDYAKGGSGPDNYANLDRLYGIQADQAEFLGQTFKGTVAPAYKRWMADAEDYGSTANQEQAAERAGKAVSGATSQQQRSMEANMASMGINPADARYQQTMKEMGVQGAAQQATAETGARDNQRQQGFARMQDVIGMGMGTPTQASQAAAAAAKSADISLTNQNQAQQNQANSVGNIVRAGTNIWGAYQDANKGSGGVSYAADGGLMRSSGGGGSGMGILRLKQGGYVHRLAKGGFAGGGAQGGGAGGFAATPTITPPPARAMGPKPMSPAAAGASAAATPAGMAAMKQGVGMAAEAGGNAAGSPGVAAFGRGMQLNPSQAKAASEVYNAAAKEAATKQAAEASVDKAMGARSLAEPEPLGIDAPATTPTTVPAEELTQLSGPGMESAVAPTAEAIAPTAELGALGTAEVAAPVAAEVAAPVAAEGLAASGAGLAAAGAVGTAVPIIGAGLALYGIGNAAGWWKDGGRVGPDGPPGYAKGGEVDMIQRAGGGVGGVASTFHPGPIPQQGDMSRREMFDPAFRALKVGRDFGWFEEADGGEINSGSRGQTGEVDGPGGPKDDEILAALSDGEFVMPIGAVKYYGIDRLEKMRAKGLEHEKQMGIGR